MGRFITDINKPESGSNTIAILIPPMTLPRKQRKIRKLNIVSTIVQLKYDNSQMPRKRPAALRTKKIVREYVAIRIKFPS